MILRFTNGTPAPARLLPPALALALSLFLPAGAAAQGGGALDVYLTDEVGLEAPDDRRWDYITSDGNVRYRLVRRFDLDHGADAAISRIRRMVPDASEFKTSETPQYGESYPAMTVEYRTGGNEDATVCIDLVIWTDVGAFGLHASAGAQHVFDEGRAFRAEIRRRFSAVRLFDSPPAG
jgi:hypothetical protein